LRRVGLRAENRHGHPRRRRVGGRRERGGGEKRKDEAEGEPVQGEAPGGVGRAREARIGGNTDGPVSQQALRPEKFRRFHLLRPEFFLKSPEFAGRAAARRWFQDQYDSA